MPGLMRGVARTAVVAGTATAVSGRVSRRQQNRWADQEQPSSQQAPPEAAAPVYQEPPPQYQPAPQPPPAEAPAAPDMDTKLAQLDQLGELKTKGILTDVEFEIQKQRILNS